MPGTARSGCLVDGRSGNGANKPEPKPRQHYPRAARGILTAEPVLSEALFSRARRLSVTTITTGDAEGRLDSQSLSRV